MWRIDRLSCLPIVLALVLACATPTAANAGTAAAHSSKHTLPRLLPVGVKCEDLMTPVDVGTGYSMIGPAEPECDFGPTPLPDGVETQAQRELPIQTVRFVLEVSPPKHWHFHYLIATCGHQRYASTAHGACLNYPSFGNRAWLEIDPEDQEFLCSETPPSEEAPDPPKLYNCGLAAMAEVQVNNASAVILVYGEQGRGTAKTHELLSLVARELRTI
jgi:hypothetical protein